MSNDAAGFIGSVPQHYDQGLGPIIFVDYAAASAINDRHLLMTPGSLGIRVDSNNLQA